MLKEETLIKIGDAHNKTPAQICLRWLYQRNIASVPRSFNIKHIIENAQVKQTYINIFFIDFQIYKKKLTII